MIGHFVTWHYDYDRLSTETILHASIWQRADRDDWVPLVFMRFNL